MPARTAWAARQLDRLTGAPVAYQWLCGQVTVNYHTLADFRVDYASELDALLTQQVAALMAAGLVTLTRTAPDGVRVRASAGSGSFRRRERLEQFQAEAQARVAQLQAQAQAEDDARGPRQQAAQERAARERLERVQGARREMAELEKRKTQDHQKREKRKAPRASTTDPEAQSMKLGDGGYRPAYNGQLAVDTDSGVIVGVAVINTLDQGQVRPMVEQIQDRYGRRPDEHRVEGGFVAHPDLETVAAQGVAVYAPLPLPRAKDQDPTQPRASAGPGVGAWRARRQTEAAQVIYKLRAQTIEWANAGVRQRGWYPFRVRGQWKAKAVLLWLALIHNLLVAVRLTGQHAAGAA